MLLSVFMLCEMLSISTVDELHVGVHGVPCLVLLLEISNSVLDTVSWLHLFKTNKKITSV